MRILKFRHWHPGFAPTGVKPHMEEPIEWLPSDIDYRYWMQFTGLKDKNGKEIYEGDVVFRKDDDLKDGNGTLIRGFQGYFEVVWHQGEIGLKDTHDCPVEVCGFVLRTIPGRFIRKPHMHVIMPERIIGGRESTDPIIQKVGLETLGGDTRFLEVIGNIYENPEYMSQK